MVSEYGSDLRLMLIVGLTHRSLIGPRICDGRIRSDGGEVGGLSPCKSCSYLTSFLYSLIGVACGSFMVDVNGIVQTEHIDNPKGYGEGEDARQYDRRLRGPVDVCHPLPSLPPNSDASRRLSLEYELTCATVLVLQPRELEIDPRTGMKNYIANGTSFPFSSLPSPFPPHSSFPSLYIPSVSSVITLHG